MIRALWRRFFGGAANDEGTIRVYAIEDTFDDEGGSTLVITGHASEVVCAGVSAIWRTTLAGLEAVAASYPRQVSFQKIEKKKTIRK